MQAAVETVFGQNEEKNYAALLEEKGFDRDKIRKYGFAFRGKEVLIG